MNFKNEVFPTPVSPTRRMVYGAFALFLGVLTIPCSRQFTPLRDTIRISTPKVLLELLNTSSAVRASRIVGKVVGKDFGTGKFTTDSVIIHDSEFGGKTRGLGSISTALDMAGRML